MDNWKKIPDWKRMVDQFLGNDFWKSFEDTFEHSTGNQHEPAANIYESGNELLCLVNLPGLNDIHHLDLYVHYQTLEVSGIIQFRYPGFRLVSEQIFQGSFKKVIELPFPVRDQPIDATYENGLLIVHLHRLISNKHSSKNIPVKYLDKKKTYKKRKSE